MPAVNGICITSAIGIACVGNRALDGMRYKEVRSIELDRCIILIVALLEQGNARCAIGRLQA